MNTPNEFFALLYQNVPDEYIAELRFIPEGGGIPKRMYRAASYMPHANYEALIPMNENFHIYHRIALSLEERSRKQDIRMVTALWVDIDAKSDALIRNLEEYRYPPTILVDSGRGMHCYWLLKEPLILANDKDRAEFERTLEGLIFDLGEDATDKAVKDCTRILRTPFYRNIKAKYAPDYPLATVVWADDSMGDRYHFEWLYKRYAPLGTAPAPTVRRELPVITGNDAYDCLPKRVKNFLEHGTVEAQGRNAELLYCARAYNDCGISQSQCENDLIPVVTRIPGSEPFSEAEARRTIASAYRYAPDSSKRLNSTMRKRYIVGDKKKG